MTEREKFYIEITENLKEIIPQLHKGISIPIYPDFYKYITPLLKSYKVKALFLKKKINVNLFNKFSDDIFGITIIFHEDNDILFFGFFNTVDHKIDGIEFLINHLIKYANDNGFKYIRGPVNLPAVIFGFGFMVEGSLQSPYAGCPVNPPIYLKIFHDNEFIDKYIEDTYRMPAFKYDPRKIKKYDFTDYEVKFPGKENLENVLDQMIELHSKNMPEYSNITPNTLKNVETLFDFIFDYGEDWMVYTLNHKPSNKVVGCGHVGPNPFSKDKKGRYNSARYLHLVIDDAHRGKGLTVLMYGEVSLKAFEDKSRTKLKYGTGSFGIENKASIGFVKNIINGIRTRRHIIVEKEL